mmetsp:Transcript_26593/g.25673  ORF Transcript_26593/g.25673 Transcript_26593/m.25673 type:complete len:100 (-) Transcript_26593:21-320(-)
MNVMESEEHSDEDCECENLSENIDTDDLIFPASNHLVPYINAINSNQMILKDKGKDYLSSQVLPVNHNMSLLFNHSQAIKHEAKERLGTLELEKRNMAH